MGLAQRKMLYTPAQTGISGATLIVGNNDTNYLDCEGALCVIFRVTGTSATGTFTTASCLPNVKIQQSKPDKVVSLASGSGILVTATSVTTDQANGKSMWVIVSTQNAAIARLPFAQIGLRIVVATATITAADCECFVVFQEGA